MNDVQTVERFYCPYKKCEAENESYYLEEGEIVTCISCGMDIKIK